VLLSAQAKGLKRYASADAALSRVSPQRRGAERNGVAPQSTGGFSAGAVSALASASCGG